MDVTYGKKFYGHTIKKREKIAPSKKDISAPALKNSQSETSVAARKVINRHRKVLIALRDR